MHMSRAVGMEMRGVLLLHFIDGLIRNLNLGGEYRFRPIDGIEPQLHVGVFEELSSLQQAEGEAIYADN